MEQEYKKEAKERSGARTDLGVSLPTGSVGRTSEKMAEKIGVSEKTYRNMRTIVHHVIQVQTLGD